MNAQPMARSVQSAISEPAAVQVLPPATVMPDGQLPMMTFAEPVVTAAVVTAAVRVVALASTIEPAAVIPRLVVVGLPTKIAASPLQPYCVAEQLVMSAAKLVDEVTLGRKPNPGSKSLQPVLRLTALAPEAALPVVAPPVPVGQADTEVEDVTAAQ